MTVTHEPPVSVTRAGSLPFLWLEITGNCQLSCVHCYAGSGPGRTHGRMTADDWERVIAEAAELGTRMVCFIGGEPSMHPDLPGLVRHALGFGMHAEIFSNLVSVRPVLWDLFSTPGVRLATSWYSSDRDEHKAITGRDTWRQTLRNIEEATRREIPLRVGIINGILPGQHAAEGEELLKARGVTNIGTDYLRQFGRGTKADPTQACGGCGHGRAAVLPDGSVTPCPLTRWMQSGNVLDTPLADTLDAVTEQASTLPDWRGKKCNPETDCPPNWIDCKPDGTCGPTRDVRDGGCNPTCIPDSYCNPLCTPGFCKPRGG